MSKKVLGTLIMICVMFVSMTTVAFAEETLPEPKEAILSLDDYEYDINVEGNKVAITATNLEKHKNSKGEEGYWIGFALVAPEWAKDVKYIFSNEEINSEAVLAGDGIEAEVDGTNSGVAFYTDAGAKTPKKYVKVQWYDALGPRGEIAEYEIDLTGVTLNLVEEAEITPAILSVTGYNYTAVSGEGNKVIITATDLEKHENKNGEEGYWIGFALTAPAEATNVKYAFSSGAITELTEEGLEEKVNGDKSGVAFYANMEDATPKTNVKVQWYAGTCKLGVEAEYVMDLNNVTLKTEDVTLPTPQKAILSLDNYDYDISLDGNKVTITATNLEKHANKHGTEGYWIGFALVAPEGATDVKYAFTDNTSYLTNLDREGLEVNVDGTNPGVAFYADAGAEKPNKYVKVQWYKNGETLGEAVEYEIDLTNVTLKLDEEVEVTPAILSVPGYTYTAVADENNKVTITAINLEKHANKNGAQGHWIGFALTAPVEATNVKYAFSSGTITDLTEEGLEEKVNEEKSGVAFYVDAGASTPKTNVKVQWYRGTCKLGEPTSYKVDLENVTLKLDIKPIPEKAKLNSEATVTGYQIDNTQEGIVKITATDLAKHANEESTARDGYWIGFALEAPEGATKVGYAFTETEEELEEAFNIYELEANVVGDKPGVAFYTDAGSATSKKYVKVQWYQGECKLGDVMEYVMDLSAVTLKSPDVLVHKAILKSGTNIGTYEVVGTKSETKDNEINVKITATDLEKHANEAEPAVEGHWLGFALVAPEGATGVKYKFVGKPEVELTRLEKSVTVSGDEGLAIYIDAAKKSNEQVEVVWVYNGVDGNIIVYNIAVNLTYNIAFNANGHGAAPVSQKVTINGTVTKPTNPTASGYTFDGWYKEAACTNAYDFTTPVTAPITLYAKWTRNSSSSGGGGSSSNDVVTYKITVTEGKHGSISPNGTVKVEKGDNQKFKIKADKGYEIEDVLVDGKSVGAVSSYTFKNVKKKHTIKATFQKIEEKVEEKEEEKVEVVPEVKPEVKPTQSTKKYTDVKEDAWYVTPIQYVTRNNLMSGVGNDKFSPSNNGTRAMIVTILYNKDGKPTATGSASFKDVAKGSWYEGPIAWAKANNIANGYQDGKFAPNEAVTREQLAVMLYNYAKAKGNVSMGSAEMKFDDNADIHTWAQDAMKWCVSNKIINGKGNNKLDPRGYATRAEIATMIMNFCEMK